MKSLLLLAGGSLALSACVIVVGDGDNDHDFASRFDDNRTAPPIEEMLESFSGIGVSSGAEVTVYPAEEFRIALDERAAATAEYKVKNGTLKIWCAKPCRNGVKGEISVWASSLTSVAVSSGADVEFEDGFQSVASLSVAVSSGAEVDAAALVARSVNVAASSGAEARVTALESLNAKASSGASVRYGGSPEDVNASKSSGASIRREN